MRRTKKKSCGSSRPSGGASAPPAEAGPAPMPQAKPEQGRRVPEGWAWQKGVTPDGRDYFNNVGTGASRRSGSGPTTTSAGVWTSGGEVLRGVARRDANRYLLGGGGGGGTSSKVI